MAVNDVFRSRGFLISALAFGVIGAAAGRAQERGAQDTTSIYRQATAPVDARVADLLARMTLEEKVAQLQGIWNRKREIEDAQGRFDPTNAQALIGAGIGEVSRPSEIARPGVARRLRPPREHAVFVNAVQKWLTEQTRLGIPAMFHEEALHGLTAPGGTHFPVPIGLASSWDPALIERLMSAAAVEARARGVQHVLSPVVDLGRDPRWGRIEETYGEDPYLVTQMGIAAVRGYQGTTLPLAGGKVFSTLKHFAGHGSHEGGVNTAPPLVSERLLRAELLVPFEAAVKAGAYTVMPSYNEVDGVPAHASRWLLTDILRREWGFTGLVVSDYFGIEQMQTRHRVAVDKADAAAQALDAGVDLELPDPYGFSELVGMVKSGRISESAIDRPVAGMLKAKFLAGLFENPYADPEQAERVANTPAHQALALEAARKSIVLLKNERGLLPLDRTKLKTLAVIGPNAKGMHLGGYSSEPGRGVDMLTGITALAGAGVKVVYAEGARITEHAADWNGDKVVLGDPVQNRARIQEAIAVARQADAVVLVIGTNESVSREAWGDNHLGDVADLRLMSNQEELVEAMLATGKPVIALLINGRPLALPLVADRVPAIVEAWYAGQEGGTAVGEVLFGDVNPGGKLPVTFPRHTGQLPVYYNRRPTSYRNHLDLTREPLWAFGFGLSYTTFRLDDLRVASPTIGSAGRTDVTVRVTNTGTRAGDEVVQLYIRDQVSSVTRPVKELRGFARVTLKPAESKVVTFTLGPAELSMIDRRMQRVVEPGRFDIMVGASAMTTLTATLDVVAR
jgi:beta-glucosidase